MQFNEPQVATSSIRLVPDKNNPLYHPFNFLASEYGNDLEKMITRINGVLAIGLSSQFIKSRKLRSIVRFLQLGMSALIFSSEFVVRIRHYIKCQREEDESPHAKQLKEMKTILECGDEISMNRFTLETEIALWFLDSPKLDKIKLVGYYDMNKLEKIPRVDYNADGRHSYAALVNNEGQKILLLMDVRTMSGRPFLYDSVAVSKGMDDEKCKEFRTALLFDFIQSFDTAHNVVEFTHYRYLTARPRYRSPNILNQFDVEGLIQEIRMVLNKGRRRAYAFVGKQGVGKSSILRAVEEVITEFKVIRLSERDLSEVAHIEESFSIISKLQPAVVLIEDLDSCGFKDKNARVGAFLDAIDEVNQKLNIALLVTINDTSMVHWSIMNRPGRFDRVFKIETPKTTDEIFEVIMSKIRRLEHDYCGKSGVFNPRPEDLSLDRCLQEKFTQAEITSAITDA